MAPGGMNRLNHFTTIDLALFPRALTLKLPEVCQTSYKIGINIIYLDFFLI
jgi:hypothetical protein